MGQLDKRYTACLWSLCLNNKIRYFLSMNCDCLVKLDGNRESKQCSSFVLHTATFAFNLKIKN